MKKRIISLCLVFMMILSMSITASAQETPSTEGAIPIDLLPEGTSGGEGSQISPFSLSLPTELYDLRDGSYPVTLTEVGSSRLYTNRTFRPDSNQRLYVSVTVKAKKNTTTFKIGYYDITAGENFGEPYTIDSLGTSSKTVTIYAYEMNPSHEYAIYFTSNGAVATGTGTVYHGT